MLAYCGLDCSKCPIYVATREKSRARRLEMRIAIAKICTEHYGMLVPPEEINDCDGCRSASGRIFSRCANCAVRNCAGRKNIESCAVCRDWVCDNLLDMFMHDPCARKRLEDLRKTNSN